MPCSCASWVRVLLQRCCRPWGAEREHTGKEWELLALREQQFEPSLLVSAVQMLLRSLQGTGQPGSDCCPQLSSRHWAPPGLLPAAGGVQRQILGNDAVSEWLGGASSKLAAGFGC